MPVPYAVQADLEISLGGADRLLELADFAGAGNLNDAAVQTVIQGWLLDGAAEVRSATEIKHDPEVLANLDSDSLRRLRDANASLSARVAFEKGTGGLAVTEHVAARAVRADEFLDALATGRRRLGRVAGGLVAAINQPAASVDFDSLGDGGRNSDGTRAGSLSVRGFTRGFR